MSNSNFFTDIGNVGAAICNAIAPALGVQFTFSHRGASAITLTGFLKGTRITEELFQNIVSAGQTIEFFAAQQTSAEGSAFPATDEGISLYDTINWTFPLNGTVLPFTIQKWHDFSGFGTMFVMTCVYSGPRQAGDVGIG